MTRSGQWLYRVDVRDVWRDDSKPFEERRDVDKWTANPQTAKYYGEVIFGGEGFTDYNYAFTDDENADPRDLAPENTDILEWALVPNGDRGGIGDLSF